jgi:hypothetical protein
MKQMGKYFCPDVPLKFPLIGYYFIGADNHRSRKRYENGYYNYFRDLFYSYGLMDRNARALEYYVILERILYSSAEIKRLRHLFRQAKSQGDQRSMIALRSSFDVQVRWRRQFQIKWMVHHIGEDWEPAMRDVPALRELDHYSADFNTWDDYVVARDAALLSFAPKLSWPSTV